MNNDMTRDMRREPWRFPGYTDIVRDGWSLYFAILPQWIWLALPVVMIGGLFQAWVGDSGVRLRALLVGIPYLLLSAFAGAVLTLLMWRELRGGDDSLSEIWGKAASRLVPILLTALGVGLLTGIGTVCFILPGLWIMARLLFAQFFANLAPDRGSPITCSYNLTKGRFWWTMGLLATLALVACGLFIPAVIVKFVATGLVGEFVYGVLVTLLSGPLTAAMVVAFDALLVEHDRAATGDADAAPSPAVFTPPTPTPLPAAAAGNPGAPSATPDTAPAPPQADEELSRGGAGAAFE